MSLSIKPIKQKINGKCAVCGAEHERKAGYALFLPETENSVCDDCAVKDDPKLLAVLKLVTEL